MEGTYIKQSSRMEGRTGTEENTGKVKHIVGVSVQEVADQTVDPVQRACQAPLPENLGSIEGAHRQVKEGIARAVPSLRKLSRGGASHVYPDYHQAF